MSHSKVFTSVGRNLNVFLPFTQKTSFTYAMLEQKCQENLPLDLT